MEVLLYLGGQLERIFGLNFREIFIKSVGQLLPHNLAAPLEVVICAGIDLLEELVVPLKLFGVHAVDELLMIVQIHVFLVDLNVVLVVQFGGCGPHQRLFWGLDLF